MNRKCFYAVSVFAAVILSISAYAQRMDETLRGTVEDLSGPVVSGAEVTVTNQTTGVKQTTQTTSTGEYVFPTLLVGTCRVEGGAKGFANYSREEVLTADASLAVGAGGFVVGARHGRGIATCRTNSDWSASAFFTIIGGSYGPQTGAQAFDLVMMIMNDQAVNSLLTQALESGADASVAADAVGRHAQAVSDYAFKSR